MVSVCLATYNGADYIREQLISILNQLGPDDEIIISDDGSLDATLDIIAEISDCRISLICGPQKGVVKNFEAALLMATQEIIILSDQDDIWMPSKLEIMVDELKSVDLVVSDCVVVDSELNRIHESFAIAHGTRVGFFYNLYRNGFLGCCMAFRRELLSFALPFPSAIPMHDWWIGLVATLFGRVKFLDHKLLLYRRHSKNASSASLPSSAPYAIRILQRFQIIFYLSLRIFKFYGVILALIFHRN
ncbi:glycosyltransferase family 2 protein [Polynucleobacter paneuropaeus]|uniref:glycosyltransferase family 2 protein n=1 Tax=Polynucleobacter paneuropaeus TaxID=2527775 RepID=UPI001BFD2282|nr:glycosyltransferase family 2 protein [Polynucleobacter paneuropaeus]MBT8556435.1 glycosyltransferase family 2 protein [Polynucleobacter paneuropaeus]MBT8612796.1 glycosyltransferase family 2 protein [Polynucleobacter paneuropaeus]MBT8634573.1 glycosyltransferase family 2 protein [Polynucleobacter paneuropaeus]QWD42853.1 glycosyltransferase family 2 protein [Polynucleobacter paneuropaeus]QWD51303.1 glycosyltransferase family 2 protein [Polynucleobacter paneuropaeus]